MSGCQQRRNYLTELRELMRRLRATEMEPECCNVSCPPLGCPRGPCPGMCRDERGCVDPCGLSEMPPGCCTGAHFPKPSFKPKSCCHMTVHSSH